MEYPKTLLITLLRILYESSRDSFLFTTENNLNTMVELDTGVPGRSLLSLDVVLLSLRNSCYQGYPSGKEGEVEGY